MKNGDTVWIYPHGSPEQATTAMIDIIAQNGRSIALRLLDKPAWVRIDKGVLLRRDDYRIEILLTRATVGPWVELLGGGHYEIETEQPLCRN